MPRPVLVTLVVAACALPAAGCGGGGGSPGVADIASPPSAATTATTSTTTTQTGSGSSSKQARPIGPSGQFQIGMNVGTKDGTKFSECMREHGVTNFPDPNGQGVIMIHSGMGIDPGSPTFTSARSTCSKLLPNGGQPTPAEIAQRQREMLQFSTCMRAHGLKDFPDPSSGGLRLTIHPGSDLDPNNPTFRRAQQACQKYLPFKGAGIGAKGG